jgi:hypothetical protein
LERSPALRQVLTPELRRLRLGLAQPQELLQGGNHLLIWRRALARLRLALSLPRSDRRHRPQRLRQLLLRRLPALRALRQRRAGPRRRARAAARGRSQVPPFLPLSRHQASRPETLPRRRVSQGRMPDLRRAGRVRSLQVRLRLRLPLEGHLSRAATSPASLWRA